MDTKDPTTVAGRGFGINKWSQLFTNRQLYTLLTFIKIIRGLMPLLDQNGIENEKIKAICTILGLCVSKLSDFSSTLCTFNYTGGRGVKNTFARQALPMVWDFAETNPFNPDGASWPAIIEDIPFALQILNFDSFASVSRGSALNTDWQDESFDAIITDPPYYDNVSYAVLSDFFYIWLKRSIGHFYPEHFVSKLTPKKSEAISDSVRHGGKQKSHQVYENMMIQAFREAHRILKNNGYIVVVYAHKTTLGWSTLVDGLRNSGFSVEEAWSINTEKPGRVIAQESAALSSSIFLVARKRNSNETGSYEADVRPELEQIVHERVETLWKMGITGADLVIAAVGAGLRAFTRFSRVEYANGEEVPAEKFLAEVETIVLEAILKRLSKELGANGGQYSLAGVDLATRFYILWRYTYKFAVLDAGEAIVFANGNHIELDGPNGLSSGARALLEKKKGQYQLNDYSARGEDKKLGQRSEDGQPASIIDILHRTLWLMENQPAELPTFLHEVQPNREQLRLVAQALAGPALKGGELGEVSSQIETSALTKLTSNWKSVIESAVLPISDWEKTS